MTSKTGFLSLVSLAALCTSACTAEISDSDGDEHADEATESVTLTQPIAMRSGSWWGDVNTPLKNQVWGEIDDATPGKKLTSPITYHWSCKLPFFSGSSNTLKLTSTSFSINSDVVKSVSNPTQGQTQSFTLDPSKYPSGWIEVRIRCKGTETAGSEKGKVTAITAGFPVQLENGTSDSQNHSGTNYVDTHGWYDRGVGYVYATILNISDVVGAPLKGTVPFKLKGRTSGDTTLNHFMVKIDGVVATMADGNPAEFSGSTGDRTISIDTTKLSNGSHVFAMHAHGLEKASSEQPGKQLAAQVEVTIDVENP